MEVIHMNNTPIPIVTLASNSYCYQSERFKHFLVSWLRLCSCLQKNKEQSSTSLRASLCSTSYTDGLIRSLSDNDIWSFQMSSQGVLQLDCDVLSWKVFFPACKDIDALPFLGAVHQVKLCNSPSSPQSGQVRSSDWRETGRAWQHVSRHYYCLGAEVGEDFFIKLLRLVPGSLPIDPLFLSFGLQSLGCCS